MAFEMAKDSIKVIDMNGNHTSKDLVFAFFLVCGIVLQIAQRPWSSPITWDGFGYYLYLPLVFVHQDLGMNDPQTIQGMFDTYHPSGTFYQAHKAPTGNMVIRYTPGLALIHLPSFLVAHFLTQRDVHPADGLSFPYQLAATVTALLVLLVGLWATQRVLRRFIPEWSTFLTTALLLYGTNLMDQAVEQLLMTHLYSFSLYALLLLTTIRLHEDPNTRRALITGSIIGMLILVRPPNALAVLIPLLWPFGEMGPLGKLRWLLQTNRLALPAFFLGVLLPVMILLGYWKGYAGSWIYDSYQNPGEGLDLFYPHLHRFLFSFRKGWFIYTPIMLIALFGIIWAKGPAWNIRRALLPFLAIHIYVVSSWTLWYYPGGFGQRAAVDVYPIMSIGLGAAVTWAHAGSMLRRWVFFSGVIMLVVLLQFQVLQQRRGVRPPDRMTMAYYWSSFFDIDPQPSKQRLLAFDRPTVPVQEPPSDHRAVPCMYWEQALGGTPSSAPDGSSAFEVSEQVPFTPAFQLPMNIITGADHAWLVITGSIYVQDSVATNGSMVVHMDHDGAYGYRAWDLKQPLVVRPGAWSTFKLVYLTPVLRRPWDELRIYAWHRGGPPFWMKDLRVERYAPIQ
jgi:hypothetical protein